MPYLLIEKGAERGKCIPLKMGEDVILGRDQSSSYVLEDPMASRKHCVVGGRKGHWLIKDLHSVNGTFLNGQGLEAGQTQKLEVGSSFRIGETLFSFMEDRPNRNDDPLIGKTIAGYEIESRLGRGAMGVVYQARQLSLNRSIALKLLSEELSQNKKFTAMFLREARAAAALNHPHILQVYDAGEDQGFFFMSMEIAEKGSVLEELRSVGAMELDRSLAIVQDTLEALEYAEKKGIVHRDIKPDNLMLSADRVVKVGDLGLALPVDQSEAQQTGVFGTPHYIAPEQALGKAVDNRADIYALGASWYRMLTGKPLFQAKNIYDIIKMQVNKPHTPIKEHIPDVPSAISKIIDKMLAKNPDERYQSAAEVSHDIALFLRNQDLSKQGRSFEKVKEAQVLTWKRKPKKLAFFALGLIALLLGVLFFFDFSKSKTPPKNQVQANREPFRDKERREQEQAFLRREQNAQKAFDNIQEQRGQGLTKETESELERIIKTWPQTRAAQAAQDLLNTLRYEQISLERNALEAFKEEWETLALKVEEELIQDLKLQTIREDVKEYQQKIESSPYKEVREYASDLDIEEKLRNFEKDLEFNLESKLDKIGFVLTRSFESLEEEIEAYEGVLLRAEELQKELQEELHTFVFKRVEKWQQELEVLREKQKKAEREQRENRAEFTQKQFSEVLEEIHAAVRGYDFKRAKELLEEFEQGSQDLEEFGESSEFVEIIEMIEDRKEQTRLEREALIWISTHWNTSLAEVTPEDAITEIFPEVTKLRIRTIHDQQKYDPSLEFLYETDDKETMRWDRLDEQGLAILLSWVTEHDKDFERALSLEHNLSFRMGLSALLLEMGSSTQAYYYIAPVYNHYKSKGSYEDSNGRVKRRSEVENNEARRAREYFAYTLLFAATEAFKAGNIEEAERYHEQFHSEELQWTRARVKAE